MPYEERTYHGIKHPTDGAVARLVVERPGDWVAREHSSTPREVLRELADDGFGWGYNGTGTSRTAAAILADALDLGNPEIAGIAVEAMVTNDDFHRLREDFCAEVLTEMSEEFALSRTAVLRWVRGWYSQTGIVPMPYAVRNLPPLVSGADRRESA